QGRREHHEEHGAERPPAVAALDAVGVLERAAPAQEAMREAQRRGRGRLPRAHAVAAAHEAYVSVKFTTAAGTPARGSFPASAPPCAPGCEVLIQFRKCLRQTLGCLKTPLTQISF